METKPIRRQDKKTIEAIHVETNDVEEFIL